MEFTEPDILTGPRRSTRLRYQECIFLRKLAESHPHVVSHEEMAIALYDAMRRRRPKNWQRCIYMLAAELRESARRSGCAEPAHWIITEDNGYKLDQRRRGCR